MTKLLGKLWRSTLDDIWQQSSLARTLTDVWSLWRSGPSSTGRGKRKSPSITPVAGNPATMTGEDMPHGVQYVCYVDETGYYLGSAEEIAEYLDLEEGAMSSAWVPAQADGNLSLIRVKDVNTFWQALGVLSARFAYVNAGASMDQTVHLFMPCGTLVRYVAFDDIPWDSVPCTCGDAKHWVIWYTGREAKT